MRASPRSSAVAVVSYSTGMPTLLQPLVQRRDEVLAAAQDVARQAAPELEFAVHLERLPPERRLKPHAVTAQP